MFGNCLWFELNKNNTFYNDIIIKVSQKFNLKYFNAHITKEYNLDLKNLNKLKNIKKIIFYPIGKIYSTSNKNFYSLQIDLKNNTNNEIYHISLSYRVDRPYNDEEINYINTFIINKQINTEDYDIKLYNCNSINSDDWFHLTDINI